MKDTTRRKTAEVIQAAEKIRSWCADRDDLCTGCPFSVQVKGMQRPDCILCDCFPGRWNIGEIYNNESEESGNE